jgi:hypothetical protein
LQRSITAPATPPLLIAAILLLALARGGLYANALPPWGLIDEEQHVHFVQSLAEAGAIPIVGETPLSPEIVDSAFATRRWETFHWPTPPGKTPEAMGLEGYSYEGYQPPLYYALLAPIYAAQPLDMPAMVYALRWATVLLSLIAAWLAYRTARLLFPGEPLLPVMAALLLIALPERTAAVSRVNNDALLEVIAAAFVWLCTLALIQGVTPGRSRLMGLLFGLGLLTKTSMAVLAVLPVAVFWFRRRDLGIRQCIAWAILAASVLALPFFARNLSLYGDPTGLAAFKQITNFAAPQFTAGALADAVLDLFRNQWVIWWKGALPGDNLAVTGVIVLLALSWGLALVGLFRSRKMTPPDGAGRRVLAVYAATIGVCALAVLRSYFAGDFPVIQGRFFLPVSAPIVILWSWGLWRAPGGRPALAATILLLLVADALNLFGNLLPYFYFWSAFVQEGVPQPFAWPGLPAAWQIFLPRLLADKPANWGWALAANAIAYAAALGFVAFRFARVTSEPALTPAGATPSARPMVAPPAADARAPVETNRYRPVNDPLLWVTAGLLLFYLACAGLRPQGVFWSLDEGGKFLYLENTLKTGDIVAPLAYPGRALDPEYENVPLFYFARQGDEIYAWWPVGFPLLTLPFYRLLGWIGLYVIPAFSGAACALLTGLLVRQALEGNAADPARKAWMAAAAALIAGIATPVAFYSTLFWEHTPAAALLLGAFSAVLYGLKRAQARWLALAGVLGAGAVFLRPEIVGLLIGVGAVLLMLRWRAALQFGAAFVAACIPWLLFNQHVMGGILGRQWASGPTSLGGFAFSGLTQAGPLFAPYLLFNTPRIGAYALPEWALYLGTALVALACLLPLIPRLRPLLLPVYAGLIALTGWVLFAPQQYRSLHGFVLAAPHVVFAAWLYASRRSRRSTPFPALLLGALIAFIVGLVVRAWLAAGGLQWGPRYMLPLYPLLVSAAVAGLAWAWAGKEGRLRTGMLALYLAAVAIGAGFALRGMVSATQTMRYYRQTEAAMQQEPAGVYVTRCTWMPMVIPSLYWEGDIFIVQDDAQLADWVQRARAVGVGPARSLHLDICNTDGLEVVAERRAANPSGLTLQPLDLSAAP